MIAMTRIKQEITNTELHPGLAHWFVPLLVLICAFAYPFVQPRPASAETLAGCHAVYAQAVAQGRIGPGPDAPLVAWVIAMSGDATVQDCHGRRRLSPGDHVEIDNCIQTGEGRVRLRFNDRDKVRGEGPSLMSLGPNSKLCLTHFRPDLQRQKSTLQLIRGGLRWLLNGLGVGSHRPEFSVRVIGSLCSLRGADGVIFYDDDKRTLLAAINSGGMTVSAGSSREDLRPRDYVSVQGGALQEPKQLTGAQWRALVAKVDLATPG